ncbi:type II secretion system protein [Moritella yayanosii]|nr:prepilin-type N-terminal cleavage/methylation domain-containing protein [Moritella yayanosii]
MNRRMNGFTLIELVIVIIVLGVLAATAIPKFINLQDDANRSALKGQFGAFASAVTLYHSGWLVAGNTGAIEDLASFGDGDVDSTATGYPYATGGLDTPPFTACEELWTGLTDTSVTIAYVEDADLDSADVDIAYTYSVNADSTLDTCIYRALHFIQTGQKRLTMNYKADTGEVTIR